MTQSFDEDLPTDLHKEVNAVAVKQLPMLLDELRVAWEDENLLVQHEVDFLGDLYARLIVSAYMGFLPDRMARDAIDATERLNKLVEEHINDT